MNCKKKTLIDMQKNIDEWNVEEETEIFFQEAITGKNNKFVFFHLPKASKSVIIPDED